MNHHRGSGTITNSANDFFALLSHKKSEILNKTSGGVLLHLQPYLYVTYYALLLFKQVPD